MPGYDIRKCIYCGACVSVCPVPCLELVETRIELDLSKCIYCNLCTKICPTSAIFETKKPEKVPKISEVSNLPEQKISK